MVPHRRRDQAPQSLPTKGQCLSGTPHRHLPMIFFVFWPFFKQFREMNPPETYLQDMALPSRGSVVGTTHEGVTPCALA
jgi:hypothetical protein